MTYEQIVDWVEENFDPKDFKSYVDFEQAVKDRFSSDGMNFPKGAEAYMQDHFSGDFEQPESSPALGQNLEDFIVPQTPEDDILMSAPSQDFFIGMDQPQPPQPLPEILRPVQPSSPLVESFSRISDPFKTIGKTFKSAFKRLFGR